MPPQPAIEARNSPKLLNFALSKSVVVVYNPPFLWRVNYFNQKRYPAYGPCSARHHHSHNLPDQQEVNNGSLEILSSSTLPLVGSADSGCRCHECRYGDGAAPYRRRNPYAGWRGKSEVTRSLSGGISGRRQRAFAAVDRVPRFVPRGGLRIYHLHAAEETAGAPGDARDIRADL